MARQGGTHLRARLRWAG